MSANPDEKTVLSQAQQKLREQAQKQGYKPAKTVQALLGDFWPDEENIDDFVLAVRQLRQAEA